MQHRIHSKTSFDLRDWKPKILMKVTYHFEKPVLIATLNLFSNLFWFWGIVGFDVTMNLDVVSVKHLSSLLIRTKTVRVTWFSTQDAPHWPETTRLTSRRWKPQHPGRWKSSAWKILISMLICIFPHRWTHTSSPSKIDNLVVKPSTQAVQFCLKYTQYVRGITKTYSLISEDTFYEDF